MIERMSLQKFEALEVIFFAGQRKRTSHPRSRVVNVQLLSKKPFSLKCSLDEAKKMLRYELL